MKKATLIQRLAIRAFVAGLAFASLVTTSLAQSISPAVTNLWRLAAGIEYDFPAAADGNVRGVAINPVNGNVLYATRAAGSNHIAVINQATGFVSNRLSGVGVVDGQIHLVGVKVADDGAVYGAGLAVAGRGSLGDDA